MRVSVGGFLLIFGCLKNLGRLEPISSGAPHQS